jgi:hypothetical protein
MRTANAPVLRKANATVRIKVSRFDLAYCGFDQSTELFALFFRDRGLQVLDFRIVFANEDDKGNIRNSCEPGIADQLWIK